MADPPPGTRDETSSATEVARDVVERVRSAPEVADLTFAAAPEPGSGAAVPEHVWYVSYGSNLRRERFEAYLLGGSVPGLQVVYPGGPGTSTASGERAVVLRGRLRFARDAPSWGGGGVAFWDADADGPGVLARAWRVRVQQFLEVVHLENGGMDRRPAPWPAGVLDRGEARVGGGWYSRLLAAGRLLGEPVLTFTSPRAAALEPSVPSAAYGGVVHRGLLETFGHPARGGLDAAAATAYLSAAMATRPTS